MPRGEFCGLSINGALSSNQRTAGKIPGLQTPRSHQPVLQPGPAGRPWARPRRAASWPTSGRCECQLVGSNCAHTVIECDRNRSLIALPWGDVSEPGGGTMNAKTNINVLHLSILHYDRNKEIQNKN